MNKKKVNTNEMSSNPFFRHAGDAIFIIDTAFRIMEVNDSSCRLLGYSGEELQSMKIYELFPPDEQKLFVKQAKIVDEKGGSLHERKLMRKDGSLVDAEVNVCVAEGVGYISIFRDITERKKTEVAFKESELKFKNLVEKSLVGVYIIQNGKYKYLNPKFSQLLGYTQEEMLNIKDVRQIVDEGYTPPELVEWRKKVDVGIIEDFHIELRYKKKDGTFIWAEVYCGETIYNGEKAILGSFQDITERKKAEAKILARESLLTALFNNIEGSLALYDTNKKIVLFNKHFATNYKRLTNQEPKVGDGAHDLLSEEEKQGPSQLMDSALQGNKEVFEKDYVSNGKLSSFRTSFNPVINDGKITGITSFSLDLTRNKEAEMKVRESEEKFRMSFMISQDTFYIGTLEEGRIIDVNDSFYHLFGYTREESIGKTSAELNLYVYHEQRAAMVAELKANGHIKDFELTSRKRNGELMLISVTVNLLQMNNEQVIMAVIRDITEKNRIEKELIESEVRFREVMENSISASYKRNLKTNSYDYLSPVFKKIAGYTQEEINTMPLDAVIGMMHPDDIDTVTNWINKAIQEAGRSENSIEYRFRHKDTGEYRWLRDEFVVMYSAQAQANSLIGSVTDITERKRIEAELIESRDKMTLFVEHSPASLAMFDNEMRYIATSRRWLIDYNLGDQDIIGKTHYEVFPEVGQDWKEIHQRCLKGAVERKEEDPFRRLDGTTDWLKWEIRPWHKASGKIGGIIMFTEVITEQKESELKFKNLIERSLIGVYLIQNWKFVYVNPKFAEYLGYTQEEMLNMENSWQIHDGCYIPPDLTAWSEKLAAGIIEDYYGELEYRRKDGKIIWANTTCYQTLYKGSTALTGSFLDITERKNAVAIIKEQAETFTAIIENANESIWLLSPNLTVLQFNKTGKQRISANLGKEIYIGADFREFLYTGSENVFMPMFNDALAGNYTELESRQANIHGEFFWLRTRMYPVYDTHKKLVGVTVLAENITDRKNVEIELEQSEEQYRLIFESFQDVYYQADVDGKILIITPSIKGQTGYYPSEVVGRNVSEFYANPKDRDSFLPELKLKGSVLNYELDFRTKDGKIINASVSCQLLYDNNGKPKRIEGIIHDVTQRKQTEDMLKLKNEKLIEIAFLQSHIVRSPLANILGIINLINKENPSDPINLELIPNLEIVSKELDEVIKQIVQKTKEIENID